MFICASNEYQESFTLHIVKRLRMKERMGFVGIYFVFSSFLSQIITNYIFLESVVCSVFFDSSTLNLFQSYRM